MKRSRLCKLISQLRRLPGINRMDVRSRLYPRPTLNIGDIQIVLAAREPIPVVIVGWTLLEAPEELADYIIQEWEKTLL